MAKPVKLEGDDETVVFREILGHSDPVLWITLIVVGIFSLSTGGGVLFVIAFAVAYYVVKFEKEVREDGVYLRVNPSWLNVRRRYRSTKRIAFGDIEKCEITTIGSFTYTDTDGARKLKVSKYMPVRGDGVKISMKDGESVIVGTQRADELIEAITQRT